MAKHPIFERDGTSLYCRIPVPMVTAAMGGEIEAPTLDGGRTRVKVPAGVQSGKQLRLRGKGMPARGGKAAGDLYCRIRVQLPTDAVDDAAVRRAAQELDAHYGDVRAGLRF